jgi:hypothetical protein
MRAFKLIGVLGIILALTAIAAATASAEVEFLPGTAGTKYTASSKKAILTAKNEKAEAVGVTCAKSKATGEVKKPTEAKLDITFEECTVAGLAVNSTGDAAKTILAHVTAKACTITTSPLVGGILLKTELVELTVPTTKLTVIIEGDVIGRLLPENVKETKLFTLDLNLKEGKQEFTKCKDGAGEELTEELKAKVDAGGKFLSATQSAEGGLLQFTVNEEWMT